MTPSSPLGRDSMAFREKMEKYHAEIERLVYAAEILCHSDQNGEMCDGGCPFEAFNGVHCDLRFLRLTMGDRVVQHDCMVPPCQCAGDTGEGTVRE